MKKISLIIPCYNAVSCIDTCMESIINQSIGIDDLEVILVNDASTDATYQKLCQWEQSYPESVMVINCRENGKQGQARNIGLQYATAPYIAFMDDDDIIERNMYEMLYRDAISRECDLVVSDYVEEMKEPANVSDMIGKLKINKNELICIMTQKDRLEFLQRNIGIAIWNKLYKREMLQNNDIDFPPGYIYDDIYFSELVKHYCQRVYISQQIFYHHMINEHSASYSMINPMDRIGFLEVHMILVDELRRRKLYTPFARWYENEFFIDYLTFITNYHKTFGAMDEELYRIIRTNVVEMFPDHRNIPLVAKILKGNLKPAYKEILEELEKL